MTIIQAIILAIIEGITEFLPVSSTGHMIIGSSIMGIQQDEFVKLFTVAIQFGAILSVIALYWKRFFQTFDFYTTLFVAFLPAVVAGLLLNDFINALLENVVVVGVMLFLGGSCSCSLIVGLPVEKTRKHNPLAIKRRSSSVCGSVSQWCLVCLVPRPRSLEE